MNKNIQQLALGSIFALACTLNMNAQVVSQKVGTNPTIITPSTAFEVESTNKGVLLPRVALTSATDATTILAPTTSMLVYNTATAGTSPNNVTPGYYYWTGTAWTRLTNGTPSADWTLTGNAGTVASTNFIGTTDAIDFVMRTNNTERMRVTSTGNIGIGTTTPSTNLHVNSNDFTQMTLSGSNTYGSAAIQMIDKNETVSTNVNRWVMEYFPNGSAFGSSGMGFLNYKVSGDIKSPLFITNNNNVGINTTTPSTKLHIDNGTTAGAIRIVDGTQGAGKVLMSDANGVGTWQAASAAAAWALTGNAGTVASTNFIGTTDAIDFVTRTNNAERMRVTSAGNVGIGTASPIAKLHVENGGLRVQTSGAATSGVFNGNLSNFQIFHPSGTDANIRLFNSGGSLILGVNETGAMVGNVGIGTTTPVAKLAVNGLASAVDVHGIFNINDENYPIDATTGRPGISMGYDITNDYGWIYSRRIGKHARPLVFNQPEAMIVGVGSNNYVGIGTASPSTKLHINNGTTAGAIRIVDGTQGAGKVLVSDANGVGTWASQSSYYSNKKWSSTVNQTFVWGTYASLSGVTNYTAQRTGYYMITYHSFLKNTLAVAGMKNFYFRTLVAGAVTKNEETYGYVDANNYLNTHYSTVVFANQGDIITFDLNCNQLFIEQATGDRNNIDILFVGQ